MKWTALIKATVAACIALGFFMSTPGCHHDHDDDQGHWDHHDDHHNWDRHDDRY